MRGRRLLTLEIIPVIYTYWRQEQVLFERLESPDAKLLAKLQILGNVQLVGWAIVVLAPLVLVCPSKIPTAWVIAVVAIGAGLAIGGAIAYPTASRPAKQLVWPVGAVEAKAA